jgi:hypothetical protein
LETDMSVIEALVAAATRAADLPDRAEAAGLLVVASVLRQAAPDAEDAVLAAEPPALPVWPSEETSK